MINDAMYRLTYETQGVCGYFEKQVLQSNGSNELAYMLLSLLTRFRKLLHPNSLGTDVMVSIYRSSPEIDTPDEKTYEEFVPYSYSWDRFWHTAKDLELRAGRGLLDNRFLDELQTQRKRLFM